MILRVDLNLGLGDAIVSNGLVRTLAEWHDAIQIPCWAAHRPSVAAMFSDLANVEVVTVSREGEFWRHDALSVGSRNPDFGQGGFDREFYRLAGVPFEFRWSRFRVPKVPQIEPPAGRFILIHSESSEQYRIDESKIESDLSRVFVTRRQEPVTAWVKMIAAAAEIHCLDSSFIHLVESVPSTGALYFHDYARPASNFTRRKNWNVLGISEAFRAAWRTAHFVVR